MLNLFLAYARPDGEFAARLRSALESRGYEVSDWFENLPGSDWGRIFSAIESSVAFIFIITPHSANSQVCLQELRFAAEQRKSIVPLLREDVPAAALPPELEGLQWLDVRGDSDVDLAVETVIKKFGADPLLEKQNRLLTQALQWQRRDRDKSFLLRGLALKEAQNLIDERGQSEQADIVLEFVEKGARAVRVQAAVALSVALLLVSVVIYSGWRGNQLTAAGLGFVGGVFVTIMVLKALGYWRERPGRPPVRSSADAPDSLGPDTIFVSYGRSDWDSFARVIVERLRAANMSVWIDQSFIQGGDDWMDFIDTALNTCQRMLLCVTPTALESKYVKREYRHFVRASKPIYPVMCQQTTLPFELGGIQWLDFADQEKIVSAVRRGPGALPRA